MPLELEELLLLEPDELELVESEDEEPPGLPLDGGGGGGGLKVPPPEPPLEPCDPVTATGEPDDEPWLDE